MPLLVPAHAPAVELEAIVATPDAGVTDVAPWGSIEVRDAKGDVIFRDDSARRSPWAWSIETWLSAQGREEGVWTLTWNPDAGAAPGYEVDLSIRVVHDAGRTGWPVFEDGWSLHQASHFRGHM